MFSLFTHWEFILCPQQAHNFVRMNYAGCNFETKWESVMPVGTRQVADGDGGLIIEILV